MSNVHLWCLLVSSSTDHLSQGFCDFKWVDAEQKKDDFAS